MIKLSKIMHQISEQLLNHRRPPNINQTYVNKSSAMMHRLLINQISDSASQPLAHGYGCKRGPLYVGRVGTNSNGCRRGGTVVSSAALVGTRRLICIVLLR